MAARENEKCPPSPSEYFNPLEDLTNATNNDQYRDCEDFSDSEGSDDYSGNQFLATSPPFPRQKKRNKEKEKNKPLRLQVIKAVPIQDKRLPTVVSDFTASNETLDTLSGDRKNQPFRRKSAARNLKTLRVLDRDEKHFGPVQLEQGVHKPSNFEYESASRYLSLDSRPSTRRAPVSSAHLRSAQLLPRKHTLKESECPKDRLEFYNTFSMLINLGSTKREKPRENKLIPYARQGSTEQEVWTNQCSDLIWLGLQAYISDRSLNQQDEYFIQQRDIVLSVIQEILCFKAKPYATVDVELDDNICRLQQRVQEQRHVLLQVSEVLTHLDAVESLYPTRKALGKQHLLYVSDEFRQRLDALQLWMNIVHELLYKLEVMADVLLVEALQIVCWPGKANKFPSVHVVCSRQASCPLAPFTHANDDDTDSFCSAGDSFTGVDDGFANSFVQNKSNEQADDNKKNVHFNLSGASPSSSSLDGNDVNPTDSSTPLKAAVPGRQLGTFAAGASSAVFDVNSRTSVYRHFVERSLKRSGMRKLLLSLKNLLENTLSRTRQALLGHVGNDFNFSEAHVWSALSREQRHSIIDLGILSSSPSVERLASVPLSSSTNQPKIHTPDMSCSWHTEFDAMNLPSFKPTFFFLCRIPLDVVHECLRLWLEQQRPGSNPSLLCVRQLIHECREVLMSAVIAKKWYSETVADVPHDDAFMQHYIIDTEKFEEDIKQMLEVYLGYVELMMAGLQNLPEMPKRLKNVLEDEWKFTKHVCPYIRGGESNAGNRFSIMGTNLLSSISEYLETGIDECSSQHYDSTVRDGALLDALTPRQAMLQCCRNFKEHFREARERALKALSFVKLLRKDLEIAAHYVINVSKKELLQHLADTNHVRLHPSGNPILANTLVFVPGIVGNQVGSVTRLLNAIHFHEGQATAGGVGEGEGSEEVTDEPCYMVLLRCDSDLHDSSDAEWSGELKDVVMETETAAALGDIQLDSVMLVVMQSSQLTSQRSVFEKLLGSDVRLVQEQTSCHQVIAKSLHEFKKAAVELRDHIVDAISDVERRLSLVDASDADDHDKMNKHLRETMVQCYNFGFEYHKELIRIVSGDIRQQVLPKLVDFVKQWIKFVLEKCDRGRGLRPRWASQGLDFLIVSCDPEVLAILKEDDYKELQQKFNDCIMHIIGEKASLQSNSRVNSPDSAMHRRPFKLPPSLSVPDASITRTLSRTTSSTSSGGRSAQSEPVTPHAISHLLNSSSAASSRFSVATLPELGEASDVDGDKGVEVHVDPDTRQVQSPKMEVQRSSHQQSVMAHIEQLDSEHEARLRAVRAIGRVVNSPEPSVPSMNYRRVNFRWQRGTKIGEGQFGKVYTAIRMDTGELMAMKQIRLQPNDLQTTREIVDEIQIFETISHASLVKYYGVELHKDELLIFMECCSNGTLQDAAKLGLTEAVIRKYTREVLVAVNVLHENRIVHRDLKCANIFLSQNGPLKLGDFGSAVQLKNHTTVPGELSSMAGTTAYMAPEVFTHTSPVGRGADIWSLGCVLIEMVTGNRPWPDLDNQHAIMFRVGTGNVPPVPERLSAEGRDFLSCCLQVDPNQRWTANQLLDHSFVKIYVEDNDGQTEYSSWVPV